MSLSTKAALASALKALLLDKRFSKITIQDITDSCGISRMTFYYHFDNVYDLLQWSIRKDCEDAIYFKGEDTPWHDKILTLCRVFYENKTITLNIGHNMRRDFVNTYLDRVVFKFLMYDLKTNHKTNPISEDDMIFISQFYTHAINGFLLQWVDEDMEELPETIVSRIHILIKDQILDPPYITATKDDLL